MISIANTPRIYTDLAMKSLKIYYWYHLNTTKDLVIVVIIISGLSIFIGPSRTMLSLFININTFHKKSPSLFIIFFSFLFGFEFSWNRICLLWDTTHIPNFKKRKKERHLLLTAWTTACWTVGTTWWARTASTTCLMLCLGTGWTTACCSMSLMLCCSGTGWTTACCSMSNTTATITRTGLTVSIHGSS